jgi:hypothetical protein
MILNGAIDQPISKFTITAVFFIDRKSQSRGKNVRSPSREMAAFFVSITVQSSRNYAEGITFTLRD